MAGGEALHEAEARSFPARAQDPGRTSTGLPGSFREPLIGLVDPTAPLQGFLLILFSSRSLGGRQRKLPLLLPLSCNFLLLVYSNTFIYLFYVSDTAPSTGRAAYSFHFSLLFLSLFKC